jgi:NAD(P)-dependent dehydrogenase (short-subunit alcohol dehydrogenase family)
MAPESACNVVADIEAAGGEAMADGADVTQADQVAAMVERAERRWGRVDVLVNNAGILSDKTFAKMDMGEFRRVVDVHLMGSANCTKAVWNGMRERGYGRIVFTTSSSGLYGNFGQANYGAAKAAVIGLMNVLHLEGEKYNIRVNALAPMARTAMTEGLFSADEAALLSPEAVTPAVLFLASEVAPSRVILGAGGGVFAVTHIAEAPGFYLDESNRSPEAIQERWMAASSMDALAPLHDAFSQSRKYVAAIAAA